MQMMEDTHSDFTMTFRQLGVISMAMLRSSTRDASKLWALTDLSRHEMFQEWTRMYAERQEALDEEEDLRRRARMNGELIFAQDIFLIAKQFWNLFNNSTLYILTKK